MRERRTLAQMASGDDGQPMQIAGKPADVCPYCGAGMLANGKRQPATEIRRYVYCRNSNCGKKFESKQPPATLVREIGISDEPSSSGQDTISFNPEAA